MILLRIRCVATEVAVETWPGKVSSKSFGAMQHRVKAFFGHSEEQDAAISELRSAVSRAAACSRKLSAEIGRMFHRFYALGLYKFEDNCFGVFLEGMEVGPSPI
jgi:hypothetical protein